MCWLFLNPHDAANRGKTRLPRSSGNTVPDPIPLDSPVSQSPQDCETPTAQDPSHTENNCDASAACETPLTSAGRQTTMRIWGKLLIILNFALQLVRESFEIWRKTSNRFVFPRVGILGRVKAKVRFRPRYPLPVRFLGKKTHKQKQQNKLFFIFSVLLCVKRGGMTTNCSR